MTSSSRSLKAVFLLLLHHACCLSLLGSARSLATVGVQLNVTAITSRDGDSILQCWSVEPPFGLLGNGQTDAVAVSLGSVSGNATFIIQGPASIGGGEVDDQALGKGLKRTTIVIRWSWFVSGLGHVTLPTSTDEAWIVGGKYGLVFADDVSTSGHDTTFPSGENTVILGLPTADGQQPNHQVVHEGACDWEDLIAFREDFCNALRMLFMKQKKRDLEI